MIFQGGPDPLSPFSGSALAWIVRTVIRGTNMAYITLKPRSIAYGNEAGADPGFLDFWKGGSDVLRSGVALLILSHFF